MSQDMFISHRTASLKKKGHNSLLINVKCITVILDTVSPEWNKKSALLKSYLPDFP